MKDDEWKLQKKIDDHKKWNSWGHKKNVKSKNTKIQKIHKNSGIYGSTNLLWSASEPNTCCREIVRVRRESRMFDPGSSVLIVKSSENEIKWN